MGTFCTDDLPNLVVQDSLETEAAIGTLWIATTSARDTRVICIVARSCASSMLEICEKKDARKSVDWN